MSNEQFLAICAINLNQLNPQNSGQSWSELFGKTSQGTDRSFTSGQLPLETASLLQSNTSVLVGSSSQSTERFVALNNFSAKNILFNPSVTSWQFNSLAEDTALSQENDPVRQKIADSFQQPDLLKQPDGSLTQIIDLAQQKIASFFQQLDVAQQLTLAFGQGVDLELLTSCITPD